LPVPPAIDNARTRIIDLIAFSLFITTNHADAVVPAFGTSSRGTREDDDHMNFKKTGILAALLSGFLLLGSALPMHADDRDRDRRCERQIHNAEEALNKAIRRHGEHSRQAEQKRH